jgi:hypothetical protein
LLYLNPVAATVDETLLGVATSGVQKFRVDAEGDTTVTGRLAVNGPSLGDYGVSASGQLGGGVFLDSDGTSSAVVAGGVQGVQGGGTGAGGYFVDSDSSGYAYAGYGDTGVEGHGSSAGGHFVDDDSSGYAWVAVGDLGVQAVGNQAGGVFLDRDGSGIGYAGQNDYGFMGYGDQAGGFFSDADGNGYAEVGVANQGIKAYGDFGGGYFQNTSTGAEVYLGNGSRAILAQGTSATVGAVQANSLGGTYGILAKDGVSTDGNGSKSFVQNHPHEKDKVIRYKSLEGDEAGTYTRGSGRLIDGIARIPLGETFRWVTNPDLGLTAHLTARAGAADLFVDSLSTTEIVVRGAKGSDAAFDFVVFGLRIGFEEQSIVADKYVESLIPQMKVDRELYEKEPDLRRYTALARFEIMETETRGAMPDRSRSRALEASIGRYDPDVHGPLEELLGFGASESYSGAQVVERKTDDAGPPSGVSSSRDREHERSRTEPQYTPVASTENRPGAWVAVMGDIEPGDVLVLDPLGSGNLQRGELAADPAVAGVASDVGRDGQALVVFSGLTICKVDAGYGEIRVGDILTVSPTSGHAMRSSDLQPGTIVGKAAESLDSGTGTIRVLITLR